MDKNDNLNNLEIPVKHGSYGAKLFDPKWKAKRQEILQRDENKCVFCGSTGNLQIHHRQYHFSKTLQQFKDPWDYNNALLLTACEPCHKKGHNLYDIPVKEVK